MSERAGGGACAAYQGAPGAFSEEAARLVAGADATLLPCRTLEDVFAAVDRGDARRGVVPIENTLAGPVPRCADLLGHHDVHVTAERTLEIVHALIAAPGVTVADVRRVFSHPVALAQCETFFRSHPAMTAVPSFDTAGAVADVLRERRPDAAAIASRRAAALLGGAILADAIQDSAQNFTRFVAFEPGPAPDPRDLAQPPVKSMLMCDLPNEPGALLRALEPFAARALNLTRIESRPIKETPFTYRFLLEVAPVARTSDLQSALSELRDRSRRLRTIGHLTDASVSPRETPDRA
jgi:prephenate dehydratase